MLFQQPIILFFVIWICFVSSHVQEDASDSRQLTSDKISKISTWTREQDDDEQGKFTVESDERSLMSEIAEDIQDLHRKYFPCD